MALTLGWPDARRLLRKRTQVIEGLNDPELSGSLQAFLSWRALIVVAKGCGNGGTERGMIESLVHSTVTHFPTLRPALGGFIRGISALAKQSPAVLEEWYGSPDDDPVHNQERTAQARRRCQRLVAWISTTRLAGSKESSDIATELYAIRNSAIAHASVHTTGNVFLGVIGPFGHLAAQLTCAAIALRAGCDLAVVFQDAQVDA